MKTIMYKVVSLPENSNFRIMTLGYFSYRDDAEIYIKYTLVDDFLYYDKFKKDEIYMKNRYRIEEVEVEIEEIKEVEEDENV